MALLGFLAYLLAEEAGLSGIFSVFFCGITMRWGAERRRGRPAPAQGIQCMPLRCRASRPAQRCSCRIVLGLGEHGLPPCTPCRLPRPSPLPRPRVQPLHLARAVSLRQGGHRLPLPHRLLLIGALPLPLRRLLHVELRAVEGRPGRGVAGGPGAGRLPGSAGGRHGSRLAAHGRPAGQAQAAQHGAEGPCINCVEVVGRGTPLAGGGSSCRHCPPWVSPALVRRRASWLGRRARLRPPWLPWCWRPAR